MSVGTAYVFRKLKPPLLIGLGARVGGDDDLGGENVVYANLQLFGAKKRLYGKLALSSDYNQLAVGYLF